MKILDCLIIEDAPEFATALTSQIKKLVLANISLCESFDAALETLRTKKFDLIFLDIRLGEQSGLDLLKIFTNLPPVIVLSNYSEYAQETYDMDVVADYVLKPCTDLRLLKAINRAMILIYSI
jgi:two-component system, LytTR family, response regulator LytT